MRSDARAIIGIDAGTTSAKAVVIDEDGVTIGTAASAPIPTDTSVPGGSEQNASAITHAVGDAIRGAVAACDDEPMIAAAAIAAQSGSAVPVRRDGERGPVITWMDTRSQPAVDDWSEATKARIRSVSGWTAGCGTGLATITWRGQSSVPSCEAPLRWASVDDHLVQTMTGTWVTNPSNAVGMQLLDVSALHWSPELCRLAGVGPEMLSTVQPTGHDLGPVGAGGVALGLSPGGRMIVGGHDQACAAVGLGATDRGDVVLSAGTAWVLSIITPHLSTDTLPADFNLSPHVLAGRWSASRNLGPLGAALGHHVSAFARSDLDEALAAEPATVDDPHFLLKLDDPGSSEWGEVVGLEPGSSPIVTLRAAFEACAFAVREALDAAPDPGGSERPLRFVGGGTRSRHLAQLIADTTSRDVLVFPDASWPALGAARIAATAVGHRSPPRPNDSFEINPRRDVGAIRELRYLTHRELTPGVQP